MLHEKQPCMAIMCKVKQPEKMLVCLKQNILQKNTESMYNYTISSFVRTRAIYLVFSLLETILNSEPGQDTK